MCLNALGPTQRVGHQGPAQAELNSGSVAPRAWCLRTPERRDRAGNPCRRRGYILVLPNPDHRPAVLGKGLIDLAIASYVSLELGPPVAGVVPRVHSMIGAAVPKATIDKDRYPNPREDDVGADEATTGANRVVLPKTKACTMKGRAQPKLGLRIPTRIPPHPQRHRRIPRVRVRSRHHATSAGARASAPGPRPVPGWSA